MKLATAFLGLALPFTGISSAAERNDHIRVDANVVLINATVLGPHDRPVRGLTRDQFQLFEDKTPQSIAYFSEEEVPVSLAVIFDVSGSMDGKLAAMREALDAVLKSSNPDDEVSLVTFADEPQVALGWSPNLEEVENRLLQTSAHGQTSLLDALRTGLSLMKTARNSRKALVVFSDGGDNHSRSTEREFLHSLEEADVQIYAIASTQSWSFRNPAPEEFLGPGLLDRICDHAGGRYFQADSKRELQTAADQIARELRSQYLVGYVPETPANDARFHHVRLSVKPAAGSPKLTIFWRKGYRAAAN